LTKNRGKGKVRTFEPPVLTMGVQGKVEISIYSTFKGGEKVGKTGEK